MKLYTESELLNALKQQRVICLNSVAVMVYDGKIEVDKHRILNAPSPPLPEGIEIDERGINTEIDNYLDKCEAIENDSASWQDIDEAIRAGVSIILSKLTGK